MRKSRMPIKKKKNEKVKKSSIIQPSYKKSNHNQNEKGN